MCFLLLQHQNLVSILGANLNGIYSEVIYALRRTDASKKKRKRFGVYSTYTAAFPLFLSHHNRRARNMVTEFVSSLTYQLQLLHLISCPFSEITDFMARK
jgi:hypothetical protein